MKRTLIPALLLSTLLVGGCEPELRTLPVAEADTKPHIITDLRLSAEVESDGPFVLSTIKLENTGNEERPLQHGGALFTLTVADQNGTILHTEDIIEDKRTVLHAQETAEWKTSTRLEAYGPLTVTVTPHFQDSDQWTYRLDHDRINERVTVAAPEPIEKTPYIPSERVAYTYKMDGEDEEDVVEEFVFAETGYAQSRIRDKGIRVYHSSKEGVFVITAKDPVGDINYTEYAKEKKGELLLKLPAKKKAKWKEGKTSYRIVSTDETMKTPLGKLKHAVKVKATKGDDVQYLYFHKDYGLVRVEEKGWIRTKTIKELISVKEVDQLDGRSLSEEEMH